MSKTELTAERLRELLSYDPETGIFTWRIRTSNNIKVGQRAGSDMSGYLSIRLLGGRHKAHRLALLYMYDVSPEGIVDHINGITHDNRIENLRVVTRSGNAANQRRARADNACGYLGVHKAKGVGWKSQIMLSGVTKHLGTFDTPAAAHGAYLAAKRELHSTCTI